MAKSKTTAKSKKKTKPKTDENARTFLENVRERDFAASDAEDAWQKTKLFSLRHMALLAATPTLRTMAATRAVLTSAASKIARNDQTAAKEAIAVFDVACAAKDARGKNRAASELAGRRSRAILAKRPALAAFIDGVANAVEALASHARGGDDLPELGIASAIGLVDAIAEARVGDGEDKVARKAAGQELARVLRRELPRGPWE